MNTAMIGGPDFPRNSDFKTDAAGTKAGRILSYISACAVVETATELN
jgi:hypothetical protein